MSEYPELANDLREAQHRTSELEAELDRAANEIHRLGIKASQQEDTIETLEQKLKEAESEKDFGWKQNKGLREAVDKLQGRYDSMFAQVVAAGEKQIELKAENKAWKKAAQAVVKSMNVREFPSGKHYDVETCDPAKMNALATLLKEKTDEQ